MSRDALVIGINTYSYERLSNLTAPAQDAEAIATLLEEYGEFSARRLPGVKDKQNNTIRVGQKTQVTLTQLEEAIVQLFKPEGKNIPDTALLYFSGHGLRKNKGIQEGFLATSDVNPDLGNWGIRLKWLRELLQESPIRQQIIWLDCCYSGELLNFAEADPGDRGKGRDRCFIAASREFEVAYEGISSNHSVLTEALLQALDPKQHTGTWVTNYTLIDVLNQRLQAFPQRPLFANSGGGINLTRTWLAPPVEEGYAVETSVCPYRGLTYFDDQESDAKYFYGREALTDQLLQKVHQSNFLAILGASGSGKSSLVRAGLLYQLKLGRRLSGTEQWQINIFRPREHPLQSLALTFVQPGLSAVERASELAKAEDLITAGSVGLGQLIAASVAPRVMLVVDQLEEVFTLCRDSTERELFFECLLGALERTENKLCLVLVMRADFFGKCAEQDYTGLAAKMQEHLVTVTPMNQEQLQRAIAEPAKQVGLEVEQELVNQMITDVKGQPGSLPLLQYTLTELWFKRTSSCLTLAAYARLGGVGQSLQKRATEVYEEFSLPEQRIAKRIFLELTQLGEGTEDTRRQVLKRDLVTPQESEEMMEQVLQRLADAKLVVTSTLIEKGNQGQVAVVDVAHEALIRHWRLLREWVNENREALRRKRNIEEAAQEWLDRGKPGELAYLLQGSKLTEAEDFLQRHADTMPLSVVAGEFILVSQAERNRLEQEEEKRRQRELEQERKARKAAQKTTVVAIAAGFLLLVFGVLTTSFSIQAQQRKNTTIRLLLSEPQILLGINNQLEALIASVKALKQLKNIAPYNTEAVGKLKSIIAQVREQNRLEGHEQAVNGVSFSHDGQKIASTSVDKTVKIWTINGKLLKTFVGHEDVVWRVEFSPDDRLIASTGNDNTIRIWSLEGSFQKTLKGHQSHVFGVSFSPDGTKLATSGYDGTIRLWDIPNGKLLKTIKDEDASGYESEINSVDFSADGNTLASTGYFDNSVKLWDVQTGKLKKILGQKNVSQVSNTEFPYENIVTSVQFNPKYPIIAASSQDGKIRLWNLESGKELQSFKAHNENIFGIAFSPDGNIIASASRDKTVKLWDLQGNLKETLRGHHFDVNQVNFNPKTDRGLLLASTSDDRTLRLWRIDTNTVSTSQIDKLLIESCHALKDYLATNQNLAPEVRRICDDVKAPEKSVL